MSAAVSTSNPPETYTVGTMIFRATAGATSTSIYPDVTSTGTAYNGLTGVVVTIISQIDLPLNCRSLYDYGPAAVESALAPNPDIAGVGVRPHQFTLSLIVACVRR